LSAHPQPLIVLSASVEVVPVSCGLATPVSRGLAPVSAGLRYGRPVSTAPASGFDVELLEQARRGTTSKPSAVGERFAKGIEGNALSAETHALPKAGI
jgi:hypothetical protein